MTPRIDYYKAAPKVRDAMMAVELASRETSVPLTVRELVKAQMEQAKAKLAAKRAAQRLAASDGAAAAARPQEEGLTVSHV